MTAETSTIVRVLQLARILAETEGSSSVKSLSEKLDLPTSTVHRLLEHFVEQGFAERAPERRYRVGREFSRVGALAAHRLAAADVVRPLMHDLVAACNETCLLGVYLPASREMAFIEKVDSTHHLGVRVKMLTPRPICWGASGLAILAWLPDAIVDHVLAAALPSPATGEPLPDIRQFRQTIDSIKQSGYAITRGQQTAGAMGIAAPLFGADGRVFGDLCLTVPALRFNPRQESRLAALLLERCRHVSRLLAQPQ